MLYHHREREREREERERLAEEFALLLTDIVVFRRIVYLQF
jgi:hypothetical protein